MSNNSWQRWEIACVDRGSMPPAPLRCSDSIGHLTQDHSGPLRLWIQRENRERGPGSAQPPASGALVMSLSLCGTFSPAQCRNYTVWLFCAEGSPEIAADMKWGKRTWCHCYQLISCDMCTCYLNGSNVRKVLLDLLELSMHTSLCPPINSEQLAP